MNEQISKIFKAKKGQKVLSVQNMIKIALLSAIAFVLTLPLFRWSLPIFPGFLSLDVSDLPALVGALVLGPIPGVWIVALKNILAVVVTGSASAGIGPFANFIMGASFVLPMGYIYHLMKGGKRAYLVSCVVGTFIAAIMAGLFNLTVLIPAYSAVLEIPMDAIIGMGTAINSNITDLPTLVLLSVVPFNLLKFGLVSFSGFILYVALKPILTNVLRR